MEPLEKKERRLEFLRELNKRGVELVNKQLERTINEVALIKLNIDLEKRKALRDSKIDKVLKC